MKKKKSSTRLIERYGEFIIGILLLALSYNFFMLPHNIVYGVGGLGVIFKKVLGADPSIVILVGSLILLILSLIFLGKESTKKTILGSLLYPAFVKLTESLPSLFSIGDIEPLLEVICGSLVSGLGLGLVFKAGFTTGGTDILNHIVSKFFHMNVGKAMFYTDGVIILFSFFAFNFQTFIYSILNLYIISLMTDKVVLGISQSKAFYIITSEETSVKKFIMNSMIHGVTVLEGRGGYTGDVKKVIMCIVPTSQYCELKEGILKIDRSAFFVVTDAYEVSGGA